MSKQMKREPVLLTDLVVEKLKPPATGYVVVYDTKLKGFGVRVMASGVKSYVALYTARGNQRRHTIGATDHWKATEARAECKAILTAVDMGHDPGAEGKVYREAPTVKELLDRFLADHVREKLRPASIDEYERRVELDLLPALGKLKVAEVTLADVERMHRKVTKGASKGKGGGYAANRSVAVLSKAMSLAIKWGMRTDNPCRGIDRNKEEARERFLEQDELERLLGVLADYPDNDIADLVAFLLLTGSRKGETLKLRWDDIDLAAGTLIKRRATTKQDRPHKIPLSPEVIGLLVERREKGRPGALVFEGMATRLRRAWPDLIKRARITERLTVHDLRHHFATGLLGLGASLPQIGKLLGQSTATVTARYAHHAVEDLRPAADSIGALYTKAKANGSAADRFGDNCIGAIRDKDGKLIWRASGPTPS